MLGGYENIWGGVYTRFRDVDGNSFSLVSFDEISHALEAQRHATAEKLENERRVARELQIAKEVQARLFRRSGRLSIRSTMREFVCKRGRLAAITTIFSISGRNGWGW